MWTVQTLGIFTIGTSNKYCDVLLTLWIGTSITLDSTLCVVK